jgi:chaperone required for assembly of F1-ATPase
MEALHLPQQIVGLHVHCCLRLTHTRVGAEATLKRFWKSVEIEDRGDSLAITLDSRALKTPGGKPLLLPQSKLVAAALIVTEWENQRNVLKSHALPMVRHL